MPLSIKNKEAEELVRQLAGATGESMTEAVRRALIERLERIRGETSRRASKREPAIDEICQAYRALPLLDRRSADEILAYDDRGLP